jgi:hypothetical protein
MAWLGRSGIGTLGVGCKRSRMTRRLVCTPRLVKGLLKGAPGRMRRPRKDMAMFASAGLLRWDRTRGHSTIVRFRSRPEIQTAPLPRSAIECLLHGLRVFVLNFA